ncbi:unnamed protein product, partial [Laminaria digitata]
KTRFARPSGVTSTADGAAYITDAASCRLRRAAPTVSFAAAPATCNTTLTEVLRPSGCSSYEPPQGGDGLTLSPLSGNVWYNSWRNVSEFFIEAGNGNDDDDDGGGGSAMAAAVAAAAAAGAGLGGTGEKYSYNEDSEFTAGRVTRQCVGFPPPFGFDRADNAFDALTVDDGISGVFEDTGLGTTIRLACPTSCLLHASSGGQAAGGVRGSPDFYTDDSAVCMAAVHAGVLTATTPTSPRTSPMSSSTWSASSPNRDHDDSDAAPVVVVIARLLPANASSAAGQPTHVGYAANGVSAGDAPGDWARGFALEVALPSELTGQTLAGKPAGALGEGCGGISDGQPPQEAVFGRPQGVDAWRSANLTDKVFLYVADAGNNAVRAVSAVCSFVCENGGACEGPDSCRCPDGWVGHDCSVPSCTEGLCGSRQLCVGPEECDCIPGYTGNPTCLDALCVQPCEHGGTCGAPDTCNCAAGWFGPNCTVPVCSQTCGNGGNCTAPGSCSCPSEWSGGGGTVAAAVATEGRGGEEGDDCRVPVCETECLNGGWCMAPGTCACPPQWSGHDCAMPVCMQ